MKTSEYKKLYISCSRLADGKDYRMSDYALNMINTALDFQMHVGAVNKAMHYYSQSIGYSSHGGLQKVMQQFPNTRIGNRALAQHLWHNNMWTRAEFLRVLLVGFETRGVTGQKSLVRWLRSAKFEDDVRGQFRTKYHSLGFALFHWLCLRCGINTIKPDVHILHFVSESIGRRATQIESVDALLKIASEQKRKAFLLDAAIWDFQRDNG